MTENEKKEAMEVSAYIREKLKRMSPEEAEKYLSTIRIEGDCADEEGTE